jgi:hypothetical protein
VRRRRGGGLEGDFITVQAREVLEGAELADLQSFADEMQALSVEAVPPTEISPVPVPVYPRTWDEWLGERNLSSRLPAPRRSGKRTNVDVPGSCPFGIT